MSMTFRVLSSTSIALLVATSSLGAQDAPHAGPSGHMREASQLATAHNPPTALVRPYGRKKLNLTAGA